MRAKPEMKPWVHTDKSGLSSVGAALTDKKHCQARQDDYICVIQSIIQYGTIHFSTLCAFSISHCI